MAETQELKEPTIVEQVIQSCSCICAVIKHMLLSTKHPDVIEIVEKIPTCEEMQQTEPPRPKRTRAPSAYNRFIGECMKEEKKISPGSFVASEHFSSCVGKWREKKGRQP